MATHTYSVLRGDVDMDGKITIDDARWISDYVNMQYVAQSSSNYPYNINTTIADINGDGVVDQKDVQLIKNHLDGVSIITDFVDVEL